MPTPVENSHAMGGFHRFLSHPIVMIISLCGTLASLIAIPVAVYFAREADKTRELTYTVFPARTVIVKAGEVSELSVSYAGEPITTDVSAVQVQLWNQGRESIRQGHMHEPLVISTADGTPILEATIRQESRPKIVRLTRDESEKDQGRIGVSWNILEQGDAGIVQLILKGKPDVNVKAAAVIEDQRAIREVPFVPRVNKMLPIVLAVTLLVLATPLVVVLVIGKSRALRKKAAWERHLTPLPEDLLKAVSPLVDPRWIVRLLWYASLLLFLGGLVYASWVILWTLFRVPPTPPLNF